MFRDRVLEIDQKILSDRVQELESKVVALEDKKPTLSVPVVDEDGEHVMERTHYGSCVSYYDAPKYKAITLREAFDALEEMCGVEITYQEIKGTSKVVIYDKD